MKLIWFVRSDLEFVETMPPVDWDSLQIIETHDEEGQIKLLSEYQMYVFLGLSIDVQRARPARHGTGPCQAQPDGVWADTARHAYRAVPRWAPCLTYGLGTACWAIYRAGPA